MAGNKLATEKATRRGPKAGRTRRARRRAFSVAATATAPPESLWTDLEQTFFDGAPPEEPQAAAAAERFDDLAESAASGQDRIAALGRALADAGAVLWCLIFGHRRRSRSAQG